jgi:hypothetical protein
MSAQWYDANVSLPGCDKNMPGSIIAMARLNRPSIMVYGGTIKPGYSQLDGSVLDIVSAFQSFGKWTVTWCESSIGVMLTPAAASLTAARLTASQRSRASFMQQLTVV